MTATTPRRAITCDDYETAHGQALRHNSQCEDGLHARQYRIPLPRRSRPRRAVHCLTTSLCFGCPDDEHRRTGPAYEQTPRRAVSLADWAVPEGWAS